MKYLVAQDSREDGPRFGIVAEHVAIDGEAPSRGAFAQVQEGEQCLVVVLLDHDAVETALARGRTSSHAARLAGATESTNIVRPR